jgi:hypothetical protein
MAVPAGSDETRDRAENRPAWLRLLVAKHDEPHVMRRTPLRPLCAACGGSGKRLADTGDRPEPCPRCQGTGSEPAPIPKHRA